MKLNRLANSNLVVSELCLGTMTFGEQNSQPEAHAQLDYAVANGINFIDAAEMYPVPAKAETQGRTEAYIGEWLVKQPRDKLIVATKIGASNRDIAWLRGGPKALDEANINEALNASLKRLKTDYVDLYQIHWPERKLPLFGQTDYDPAVAREGVPIREQLEAFKTLVDAGKIRYIGLSNETPWGVIEFARLAQQHGLPRVVSIQNAYNLINRTFELNLTEVSHREDVPLLAYSPLAFGVLSGKYIGAKPAGARFTLFPPFGQRYYKQNVPEAAAAYVDLAVRRGLSPAQLAIAFVRSRWFVASTIIGATTLEQLKTNIDSLNVTLDEETLSEIQRIHQRYPNPAP